MGGGGRKEENSINGLIRLPKSLNVSLTVRSFRNNPVPDEILNFWLYKCCPRTKDNSCDNRAFGYYLSKSVMLFPGRVRCNVFYLEYRC